MMLQRIPELKCSLQIPLSIVIQYNRNHERKQQSRSHELMRTRTLYSRIHLALASTSDTTKGMTVDEWEHNNKENKNEPIKIRIEKILAIRDENVMANDWPFTVSTISPSNKLFLPHDVFLFGFFPPPSLNFFLTLLILLRLLRAAAADSKTLFPYYSSIKSIQKIWWH